MHVYCRHGEAKFWIEPTIELAQNYGLTGQRPSDCSKLNRGARR